MPRTCIDELVNAIVAGEVDPTRLLQDTAISLLVDIGAYLVTRMRQRTDDQDSDV